MPLPIMYWCVIQRRIDGQCVAYYPLDDHVHRHTHTLTQAKKHSRYHKWHRLLTEHLNKHETVNERLPEV